MSGDRVVHLAADAGGDRMHGDVRDPDSGAAAVGRVGDRLDQPPLFQAGHRGRDIALHEAGSRAPALDVRADNIEILVLPTALGAHDGLVGPFTLLDFAAAQSIVYVEIVNGAVYVQDQQQVAGHTRIVDRLRAAALSSARTAEVIRSRLPTLT